METLRCGSPVLDDIDCIQELIVSGRSQEAKDSMSLSASLASPLSKCTYRQQGEILGNDEVIHSSLIGVKIWLRVQTRRLGSLILHNIWPVRANVSNTLTCTSLGV